MESWQPWSRIYFRPDLKFSPLSRHGLVKDWIKRIDEADGGLDSFSKAYQYYGIHIQADNSVIVREWAPGAQQLYLTGDFSERPRSQSRT